MATVPSTFTLVYIITNCLHTSIWSTNIAPLSSATKIPSRLPWLFQTADEAPHKQGHHMEFLRQSWEDEFLDLNQWEKMEAKHDIVVIGCCWCYNDIICMCLHVCCWCYSGCDMVSTWEMYFFFGCVTPKATSTCFCSTCPLGYRNVPGSTHGNAHK